jgi:hypothetical protein
LTPKTPDLFHRNGKEAEQRKGLPMNRTHFTSRRLCLSRLLGLGALTGLVANSGGCTFLSQVVMTMQDRRTDAKFNGLAGKKVAVVCLDAHTLREPGGDADALARAIYKELAANVKDIKLISEAKVADWVDNQRDDVVDFRDVAKGVKADMVIGVDLKSLGIYEPGGTTLRGRATVEAKVYDMSKPQEPVHIIEESQVTFPEHGQIHVTENAVNFRKVFIQQIAHRLAKEFYAFDKTLDFNSDAKFIE